MKTLLRIRNQTKKWICPKCVRYKVRGYQCFMAYKNVSSCTQYETTEDMFELLKKDFFDEEK